MSRNVAVFLTIVLSALFVRVVFILIISPRMDAGAPLSVDASSYHQLARNLVERQIYTSTVDPPYNPNLPGTFRPPLTPLFLAAIYAMGGVNLLWGRLGLALINALTCGLTYLLGERLAGRTVGLLAGGISCLYPLYLLFVHLPLTEGLSICLTLLLITGCILYRPEYPATLWAGALGLIFGLLLLNKFANIVVLPCLALWAFWQVQIPCAFVKRLLLLGIVIGSAGLVIFPWTIRNYRVLGYVVLVNTNGGWTFYLGNNPHTGINLEALEQGTANGWIPPKAVFEPFAALTFGDTRAYEQRAVRLGREFILHHPAQFLTFALRKLRIFWSAYPHILDQLTWYPLAVLSPIGLWFSWSAWKDYLPIYTLCCSSLAIPVMFTAMPRFRAPLMPYLIILGSLAVVKSIQRWYAHRH